MNRFRCGILILIIRGGLMPISSVSSQAAVQTLQYQDVKDNIGLWWEPKENRLRQLEAWRTTFIQGPPNPALNLAMAIVLTSLATPDSAKGSPYAAQALPLVQGYLDQNPRDTVALAYYCTVRVLVLRNSGNLIDLMFQIGAILDAMDRAVANSVGQDQEWLVRLVRANLFVKLPDLLGKKEVAYQDFQFVVRSQGLHPEAAMALPTAYYYLGQIEQSRGKPEAAKAFWQSAKSRAEQLNQTATEEYFDLMRKNH